MSNAIEDSRVRAAIEHYLLDLENTQPKNTKRNYRPKQEEWKEWCQANWPAIPDVWPASVPQGQQLPGDLVDEGKLLLFMKEEAKRAVKRRRAPSDTIVVGGGGSEYESDSDLELYESTLKLQYNTVRGYVSAIQKLYDEQKSRESILRPGHRSGTEGAQTQHSCNDLEPEEEGIHGQGVGTLRDVLLSLDLPNEGFKAQGYTTKALVVVMNCGKTNQHGRMEYGSALRHRDPRSCLIGALAFWLFWRWQVEKAERFPVFQRSEDWYETKVLRRSAKEPQAPLSGQTAREWTSRFYKKAGIKVSKVSHAPRVAATQNADMAGVDEGQIRRADLGVEQNMAAGAFLELLEWLREVLLQDAVFLRESYPDHPIFQDPVFSCPEFEAFASKVQDTCTRDHEDSHTTVIQKRCRWLRRSCAHWMSLRRRPTPSPSAPAKVLQVNMRRSRELINRGAALHERRSSEQQQGMVQAGQGQAQGRAHGEPPGPREPPSFKLPRSVKSVQELLRLWRQGWGEMPSVDSLERDWGARWRPSAEKNYFSTRKIIVDEVRRRAQSDG
ncbi:centromere DNA-binding protein complex CBF3 subunit [Hirsutella rhossiliensis]|uniref:Centromere DNA-binding protein complex CBF3 subunit n=1 Tax=Hirsutella rhossiliensis TaxID=111463 RepID=A0A9P8SCI7_9HYPO|nr:centromere DNA-binding protein complex CBF3 subunit [Hirsutella rhossiliensis]KAH0957678.1 centromere DNA-binding protein complex CBF3 subunit [Hirsutella rhossiliensis]